MLAYIMQTWDGILSIDILILVILLISESVMSW